MADSMKEGGGAVQESPKEVPLVENFLAPELFSTWATGFSLVDGNVQVTFEVQRFSHQDNTRSRIVVARLVMPISGAQGLASGLYDFLKQRGLDPVPKPQDIPLQ